MSPSDTARERVTATVDDDGPRPGRWRRAARRVRAGLHGWVEDSVHPVPGIRRPSRRDIGAVMLLWAAGRALNLLLLGGWYLVSKAAGWGFGAPGYPATDFLAFLTDWDADRYGRISQVWYPTTLPLDMYGDVEPNDWAFLPVFPFLERMLTQSTGMSWQLAGVLLSILFSAGATVMLFLLLRAVTAPRAAWWATVLFTVGPLSFVFVLAYAESLFLLLLFTALLLAVRRRYAWVLVVGVVCAYTRPGVLALALALGLIFLVRWMRRDREPFPLGERIWLFVAGIAIAGAGLSWSWIADAVTGTPHAYILTETAWWTPLIGTGDFMPLTPWFRFAWMYLGVIGVVIVLAIMAGFFWWMWSRPVRRLGLVVASFAFSYGLYLFAVFLPQQSLFRLMLPMSPLLADDRLTATPRRRRIVVVGAIVLQAVAILLLWTIGYP